MLYTDFSISGTSLQKVVLGVLFDAQTLLEAVKINATERYSLNELEYRIYSFFSYQLSPQYYCKK